MRERVRRQRSSLRDALPARKMALTDFVVKRRNQRDHHRETEELIDLGADAWSSLPFAGEESDTGCGAEEYAGVRGSENGTSRLSCRGMFLI